VNIPMLTAALPESAPFEVVRPKQPLVSRLAHRTTVKDGTSGGHESWGVSRRSSGPGFLNALPVRSHPQHCRPAGSRRPGGSGNQQCCKWHLRRTFFRTALCQRPFRSERGTSRRSQRRSRTPPPHAGRGAVTGRRAAWPRGNEAAGPLGSSSQPHCPTASSNLAPAARNCRSLTKNPCNRAALRRE